MICWASFLHLVVAIFAWLFCYLFCKIHIYIYICVETTLFIFPTKEPLLDPTIVQVLDYQYPLRIILHYLHGWLVMCPTHPTVTLGGHENKLKMTFKFLKFASLPVRARPLCANNVKEHGDQTKPGRIMRLMLLMQFLFFLFRRIPLTSASIWIRHHLNQTAPASSGDTHAVLQRGTKQSCQQQQVVRHVMSSAASFLEYIIHPPAKQQ